jgi:hypothetical protein
MKSGVHPVMSMLAQRLPLTLLLDLRRPEGPDSQVLFLIEEPHHLQPQAPSAPGSRQAEPQTVD